MYTTKQLVKSNTSASTYNAYSNDLYATEKMRENGISYEQFYWFVFTGMGLLIGSSCALIKFIF